MTELRPPAAQGEGSSGAIKPGLGLLAIAAARCWIVLGPLALIAGVIWRLNGFAPPLLTLFDGVGLALWLTALFLEPAWDRMLSLQSRHFSPGIAARARHYIIAAAAAAFSVPLSLAPLGALLAFDTRMYVARILTLSQLDIAVPAGALCLLVLLLAGPSLICLSLALLTAGRAWFGRPAGTALWAACLLALNNGVLWRSDGQSGLSLGRLAGIIRDRLNLVNFDPTQGLYLSDLLVEILLLPMVVLAFCIVLLAWTSVRRWPPRPQARLATGWLAAIAALAAVCLSAWFSAQRWTVDSGIGIPGDWNSLLCTGATVLLIAFALLSWAGCGRMQRARSGTQLAWGILVIPTWAAYTLPNIFAGQASHLDVLGLLAAAAFVSATFLVIIAVIDREFAPLPPAGHIAYFTVIALTAIPVDPEYGTAATLLIRQLHQAIAVPEYRALALPMVAVHVLVLGLGLWQLTRRPRPRRPRQSAAVN